MTAIGRKDLTPGNPGMIGYLLFVASWLLHLPARIPVLGAMRIDLILVAFLFFLIITSKDQTARERTRTDTLLRVLFVYVIVTLPFVEWPGTALKIGLPNLIKAVVFYYFTVAFVRTEKDLKRFVFVFLACQIIRIVEPLTLHFTSGYWGSKASMAGGTEFLERLSGGPFDTVNPNGFAFIVCTVFPFLYFLSGISWKTRVVFFVVAPACLAALALSGSRSGLIGFAIVCGAIIYKSQHRVALTIIMAAIGMFAFSMLDADMQDRYLSTIGRGEKNEATANERAEGTIQQLYVVKHRPIFGHGLGSSPEANYHFTQAGPYGGRAIPAHNLYLETAQELGIFGLIIFVMFIVAILHAFAKSQRAYRERTAGTFLLRIIDTMQVWVVMNVVFSFASYGLSNYDWYLIGGLSVVLLRFANQHAGAPGEPMVTHTGRPARTVALPERNAPASRPQARLRRT